MADGVQTLAQTGGSFQEPDGGKVDSFGCRVAPVKILFLVTEDWYFWSHRLSLARAARDAGFEVIVATRVGEYGDQIAREGFKLVPIGLLRRSHNPWRELRSIRELVRIYRTERPHLVHHVALKPLLYGSLAAVFAGVPSVVNAIAGMGFVFNSSSGTARMLRPFVQRAFRLLLNRPCSRLILQNPDDREMLVRARVLQPERIVLIRGCGVDLNAFVPSPEPSGVALVALASRMLWDKGVSEFVEAVRILQRRNVLARFVLVGDSDPENLAAVPASQLRAWHDSGVVEWWGRRDDMPSVFAQANIVCLPSYGEGLPKVLIEAAACARPIVTTDAPGCREVVRQGENGLLVPARDPQSLANALQQLISSPSLRRRMGARGREIAVAEFSEEKVVKETLSLYRELLS